MTHLKFVFHSKLMLFDGNIVHSLGKLLLEEISLLKLVRAIPLQLRLTPP